MAIPERIDGAEDFVAIYNNITTLPLTTMYGITLEEIKPFSSGKMRMLLQDPEYSMPEYSDINKNLIEIQQNPDKALATIKDWRNHEGKYNYFIQFADDIEGKKASALYNHTAILSSLADTRLNIDPSALWRCFDLRIRIGFVHASYRADSKRETEYHKYANQIHSFDNEVGLLFTESNRVIDRLITQIKLKAKNWLFMPDMVPSQEGSPPKLRVFISYSHRDEKQRIKLENHLTSLRISDTIETWHDRKILPGDNWQQEISNALEKANVILLLISSDFLSSFYCYQIELMRALQRHNERSAILVPIILRDCDWTNTPLGTIQALPKDGLPIARWKQKDEAFLDIVKGIRRLIGNLIR